MKKVLGFIFVLMMSVNIFAADAGSPVCESKLSVKGQLGEVIIPCTTQTAAGLAEPISMEQLIKIDTSARVAEICGLMKKAGFPIIRGIACGDEDAYIDERSVKYEGTVFNWKAIMYKSQSGILTSRVAIRELTTDGRPATRLEELLLVLDGQIPYAVVGGKWLPSKHQGIALEFGYGRMGPNPKVEVVDTKADRIIKHITQDGFAPYFAVETFKKVMKKEVEIRIVNEEEVRESNRTCYRIPTEAEMKERGIISQDATLVQVLATNAVEFENIQYKTKTIAVTRNVEDTVTSVITYPYAD